MKTTKYIVKLTPHDKFFFGGEKNFGQKDKDRKGETNYFVKSNYFPQQTGVLGFIRHQLLLQCDDNTIFKDNKIQDATKAGKLIGKQSFRINEKFKFGAIQSLSPVFICENKDNKDVYYFPANKEYQCNKETEKYDFLELETNPIPLLKKYEAKIGLADLFINKGNNIIDYKTVFKEAQQVGIRKKYEGGTDNEAYYMQTFLKLNKGFSFAFIVELAENTKFSSQSIAVFGGEQQAFKMEVLEFNQDFESLIPDYEKSTNADKIVLVSDAFVENDIIVQCTFAITDTINFKFLETTTETNGNYYKRPTKSNKYTLYKKGSVFYGNTTEIVKLLDKTNFKNLGYNQYKIINK